ncbi:MAG TPA: hypothetical protein VMC84_08240 [Methanocella sp.]|uniref:DUF7262 family protein n=1 Tax=Methanocella sp. TaxID=2052833 RepID=UPI002C9B8B70|nr:hypothetical protein [Methanocella sp.]HTY91148.1 hypothetical protein [Methanocella sp.]
MELNDGGAVHLIEAALATVIVIGALYYVNSAAPLTHAGRDDSLGLLSSDMLNVMEFRAGSIEHPSLGFTLSSAAQWNDSSDELSADILHTLPPGTYYFMETPYGTIGQSPATGADMYVMPFIACGDAGIMLDCKLTLWRA